MDFADDPTGLSYRIPEIADDGTSPSPPPSGGKHTPTPPPPTHTRTHSGSSQGSRKTTTPNSAPSPTEPMKEKMAKQSSIEQNTGGASPVSDESIIPVQMNFTEVNSDLDYGSMVEVIGNPPTCQYGVVKWLGYYKDKNKPIVGLEMVSHFFYTTPPPPPHFHNK